MLPFDRFAGADVAARPRDALDRRGDGDRPRLPDRVRQGAGRGRRAAALERDGVPHRRRRRQVGGDRRSRPCCTTSASSSSPRAARPRRWSGWGSRRRAINKLEEGSPHVVDWIERGEVDLVINTPVGYRGALGRLRDPGGRGRAPDPLHHDDVRRDRGRPRDRRGRARRAGGGLAAGALRRVGVDLLRPGAAGDRRAPADRFLDSWVVNRRRRKS